MSNWSNPKWIRDEINKKWDSGRILRAVITDDGLFPLQIPLKRPNNAEITEHFAEISKWIKTLKDNSKEKIGFGYTLLEKDIHHRQAGRNQIPTHAIIPSTQDALRMINKEREADQFLELTQVIKAEWPGLQEWICKYPHRVLEYSDDWKGILAVLNWFSNNPNCGLYIRQLDISGVDTKFIEKRRGILAELLNIALPNYAINQEGSSFEQRFGLQTKPVQIRLRILDHDRYIHGISDLMIPLEQLVIFKPEISRVFITENEINGLCFPDVKDSLVIFGLGYGIDGLKVVPWLKEKEIYYWGDIDTHGFAILDIVRSFLPQTKSILMNENILLSHRHLWSTETKPNFGQLTRLEADEYRLLCLLQGDAWGKGVRLEQERISFREVKKVMGIIENNTMLEQVSK